MLTFGPAPSRRLGQSLGINNIPPKACSYACVYCQVGATTLATSTPQTFHDPETLRDAVAARLERLGARDEPVDVLTFVPDGEPTLDEHLGQAIDLLRPFDLPVAVITNGSLLHLEEVRAGLVRADWVSVKVDAGAESAWRRVNRPEPRLRFDAVLGGAALFRRAFEGTFVTETMLVGGMNDGVDDVCRTAERVAALEPKVAYLSTPTRPGAVPDVHPPQEDRVRRAQEIFLEQGLRVEMLTGYEGVGFGTTGDAEADLLAATAVHPMTEDQVEDVLRRDGAGPEVVDRLIAGGRLRRVEAGGRTFLKRVFP